MAKGSGARLHERVSPETGKFPMISSMADRSDVRLTLQDTRCGGIWRGSGKDGLHSRFRDATP